MTTLSKSTLSFREPRLVPVYHSLFKPATVFQAEVEIEIELLTIAI